MVTESLDQGPARGSPRSCGRFIVPRRLSSWIAISGTLLLGACEVVTQVVHTAPVDSTPVDSTMIVSDPVSPERNASRSYAFSGGLAEEDVVYVSLPPDSIPAGVSVGISNRRNASGVVATMVNGGFDPVPIPATVGDTLDLEVTVDHGAAPLSLVSVVPELRKPRVIRTSPTRGKRDVVLNAQILIVLSEPVDPATLTGAASTESVRLLRSGSPVAGSIELTSDGLRVEFRPEELLASNTDYVLDVGTTVTDLDGDPLEGAVRIEFRTANSTAQPASMIITPNPLLSVPANAGPFGYDVPFRASVLDAAGKELAYSGLLQWRSSDSTVLGWGSDPFTGGYVGPSEVSIYVGEAGTATITVTGAGLTATATAVVADVPFDAVTVGVNYPVCFLTVAGAAYCNGSNGYGELGIGHTSRYANSPVAVTGGLTFESISTGGYHTCALTSEGAAYCWGQNRYGQLGDGTTVDVRAAPVQVASGGLTFTQIGSGWSHTCALTSAGKAYCWGSYDWGHDPAAELGPVPTPVPGDLTFTQLRVGGAHVCGLDAGGAAYCWGQNIGGALGDGSITRSFLPVAVTGGHAFVAIDGGMVHTCGVTTAGEVYCWGGEGAGTSESGDVTVPTRIELPAAVALVQIAAGYNLTCGLTADGAAYCWGWTYDGIDGPAVSISPRRIGTQTYKAIDADNRAYGITTESEVHQWTATTLLKQNPPSSDVDLGFGGTHDGRLEVYEAVGLELLRPSTGMVGRRPLW